MQASARPMRRAAMLKAAHACFLERGFEKTTLSDVIALSGGFRPTLFNIFPALTSEDF